MDARDFFVQRSYKLESLADGKGYIFSNDLLSLFKNDDVKDYVVKKYELEDNIKLTLPKIDILFALVKKYATRFSLMRLSASDNNVNTSFIELDGERQVSFSIRNGENKEDGAIVDEINAIAIYDAVNMFYEGRKLSQYINFLKKNTRSPALLRAVNESWQEYYFDNPRNIKSHIYRILSDESNDSYYLKSINSEKYKEYGVAETFALTILELHRMNKQDRMGFDITSIALSESKIEIILTKDSPKEIVDLGYVFPSIAIRNEDQGNTSIGFYSSLEFKLATEVDDKIFFFPNRKSDPIKHERTMSHVATVQNFVDSYEDIQSFFNDVESFEEDFYFMKQSTTPDQLRAKIEEKIVSRNSPFKGVNELKDLFTREKIGNIENMATLLKLCGKAEMIDDLSFDLKFKLRYLISNVLLYGKNDLD